MSFGRRSASAKRALLAGVALVVLAGGAYDAQAQAPARVVTPSPDGLADGELYMEADLVIRDDKNKITTARGNVEVRYQGRTLRANELIYDETLGTMRAKGDDVRVRMVPHTGHVELIAPGSAAWGVAAEEIQRLLRPGPR